MKLNVVLGILIIASLGCGGSPQRPAPAAGFINQTQHSNVDLQSIWTQAQQSIAQQIDLNPLQVSKNVSPKVLPGDPRALTHRASPTVGGRCPRRFVAAFIRCHRRAAIQSNRNDCLPVALQRTLLDRVLVLPAGAYQVRGIVGVRWK